MRHDCAPFLDMTITLAQIPVGTRMDWRATFDDPKFANAMRSMLTKANEENFDRLETVLPAIDGGACESLNTVWQARLPEIAEDFFRR